MKATARTAAAKLRSKRRGRPKIEGVPREPNGRASRAKADVVALSARARMLGFSIEQARDQKAGSFLGYLSMLGGRDGLSSRQYQAAMRFQEVRNDYLKAIKAPNAVLDAGSSWAPGDGISDEYEDWCKRKKRDYAAVRSAIQEAQNDTRTDNLWAALDLVVIQEQALFHMIGSTRVLCNVLAKHFGV